MRAIVISSYGVPEVLVETELPDPVPGEGELLIRVKAFGLNRAECYFRSGAGRSGQGDEDRVRRDRRTDPSGTLAPGTWVVACLGGMGRTRNGSYAELVTIPVSNVAAVEVDLDWEVMAAVPEVFATVWSGLHLNLDIQAGQRVLVRRATSAVGQAAVQLAAAHGRAVADGRRCRTGHAELGPLVEQPEAALINRLCPTCRVRSCTLRWTPAR